MLPPPKKPAISCKSRPPKGGPRKRPSKVIFNFNHGEAMSQESKTGNTIYCQFVYFKPSGKYYTGGHGIISADRSEATRDNILQLNGGCMPGLSTDGSDFFILVDPHKRLPHLIPPVVKTEEIAKFLELSMTHLKQDTAKHIDTNLSSGLLIGARGTEDELEIWAGDLENHEHLPPDLTACFRYAIQRRQYWIRFHIDTPVRDDLPVHKWWS